LGLGNISVREVVNLIGFILLLVGTLGLLISEFATDWGRASTVTFAVFNVAGLASLAITQGGMKKGHRSINGN
jgi:hypothetical protein